MDLDILLYLVMGLGIIVIVIFALYIRYKRKNTMIIVDDGINEFEVLEELIDKLEDRYR